MADDDPKGRLQKAWLETEKKRRVDTPPRPADGTIQTKRSVLMAMGLEPDAKFEITPGQEIVKEKAYGVVNKEVLQKFLEYFEQTGHIAVSAARVNLAASTIRAVRKRDPAFEAEFQEAKERFIEKQIDEPFKRIGFEGIKEPIFNHRTGDLLGHRTRIEPTLALAYARKFDPAYREKQDVNMTHTGGVMVVGAPAADIEAWAKSVGTRVVGIEGQAGSPTLADPATPGAAALPSANQLALPTPVVDAEFTDVTDAETQFTPLAGTADAEVGNG